MLLALLALALIAAVLLAPSILQSLSRLRDRYTDSRARQRAIAAAGNDLGDPGRERRAEQRARELLRSCVNDEEWAMYRDLGFIRVRGKLAARRPLLP